MMKLFRKIHLWLSIPFGIFITLICFSGAMLVFETEITEMCRHDVFYVKEVGEEPLPVEQLMESVRAALPDSVSVTGITLPADARRTCQVSLSKPRRASVYVNPYTGEVTGRSERLPFFDTMFHLHRWLMGASSQSGKEGILWGKLLVGISTLMLVVILVTGIVIWWPRVRKGLKSSLSICVTKGWRRFWHDLHVAGGVYATLFLLVLALTGLTWSFSWYRTGFYKLLGVEEQAGGDHVERHGRRGGEGRSHRSPYAHWQEVYERLVQENPDYRQITLSDGSAAVALKSRNSLRATDRYLFDSRSGEITEVQPYKAQERAGKVRGGVYMVHVGSWGGMLTRILTFIAVLLGATLPLTGYYLWICRLGRKKGRNQELRS